MTLNTSKNTDMRYSLILYCSIIYSIIDKMTRIRQFLEASQSGCRPGLGARPRATRCHPELQTSSANVVVKESVPDVNLSNIAIEKERGGRNHLDP
jgi:hypothetical protein